MSAPSSQTKRISGTGKMQAKFDKYQKNSYVSYCSRRHVAFVFLVVIAANSIRIKRRHCLRNVIRTLAVAEAVLISDLRAKA